MRMTHDPDHDHDVDPVRMSTRPAKSSAPKANVRPPHAGPTRMDTRPKRATGSKANVRPPHAGPTRMPRKV